MARFQTENEIADVVNNFESCATDSFKHADHLTVAVCYLQNSTVENATKKMREALLCFLDHHQVDRQKYNETITVFWFEKVAAELRRLPAGASLVEKCNQVIESLNNPAITQQYYSPEVFSSATARQVFINPDLKDWRQVNRDESESDENGDLA